ncbi:hypothetical protein [Thetidibacter halocola]|uniref:Uncharacterized protein n=1 Tax=Thetidibacter halocola TaxID=2827239 RepID=A0A8J7W9H0_9RHOB|nr:hypothetical protein [Thetidibacter halocola]MBS0123350.1 hypothetical protein [Thetidibacter halocola]
MKKSPDFVDLICASTDDQFDKAFDAFVEGAVEHLEVNKKNFATLNEVGLSGVFTASLKIPGVSVCQEAHSNGHVDITVHLNYCTPVRKKLFEAKIYGGPSYHISGLEQLLSRYTTGREGRGVVLSYVKNKNIAQLVKSVRAKMDEDLPCSQQGHTSDHTLKWSFLSHHAHSCGEELAVAHVSCNLFLEGSDK